ncbi:hypothetical protein BGZ50_008072 [Haplosporangium sp. Z 11]|nr:hypothetical protein BGZ50_008072 [Haplosporangium sp. Z 11]
MAAASEQITISIDQDTEQPSTASFNSSTNGARSSPTRSVRSERRPSFSITLPPSYSRSSQLSGKSINFNTTVSGLDGNGGDSTAGSEGAGANQSIPNNSYSSISNSNKALENLEPPVRRCSVHFIPGEDDSLANHEEKRGLPKTPYPTTGEEEERIQHSLFI